MRLSGTDTDSLREEGERPFWISYADLMTALMILFLVVMVVALARLSKRPRIFLKRALKLMKGLNLKISGLPRLKMCVNTLRNAQRSLGVPN